MSKKAKSNEILKGRELLRINSLQKPISKKKRNAVISLVTLLFIVGLAYGYWVSRGLKDAMMLWTICLAILYGAVLSLVFFFKATMGKPLIITGKGIAGPLVAEFWEDIESYNWEEFKGITRIPDPTLLSMCEGVCLRIKNRGIFPRTLDTHGHSILAQYLIFFSPEQIAAAENIFKEHGIKKTGRGANT